MDGQSSLRTTWWCDPNRGFCPLTLPLLYRMNTGLTCYLTCRVFLTSTPNPPENASFSHPSGAKHDILSKWARNFVIVKVAEMAGSKGNCPNFRLQLPPELELSPLKPWPVSQISQFHGQSHSNVGLRTTQAVERSLRRRAVFPFWHLKVGLRVFGHSSKP